MSFTITTDRATTPRAHTLLDIFRHKRNRPNRLPRSPSCASASRNRPVGGGLPMVEQSGHHVDVTAPGVKRPWAPGEQGLGPAWKPSTGTLPMYRRQSASLRRSPSSGEMRARRYVISVRVAGARELSRRALPVDGKRRRPSARQRKAEARHRTEDPVADEWIVAVAKLRLEPVVLIKAIASQTPAIAGRRAVSVRRQGRAPRQDRSQRHASARAPAIAAL